MLHYEIIKMLQDRIFSENIKITKETEVEENMLHKLNFHISCQRIGQEFMIWTLLNFK